MRALLLVAFLTPQKGPKEEGTWPQFRGVHRDNLSPDVRLLRGWPPEGPALLWKADGLGQGFSSVSVADGCVYTQGHADGQEILTVLEETTGRKRLSVAIGPAEEVAYGGSRSTPTVDGDFLFVETVAGDLACVARKTGRVAWRRHLKRDFQGRRGVWGYAESPLVDGGRVIVTPGGKNAALVALDKGSGNPVWRAQVPESADGIPGHQRDPETGEGIAAYASVIVAEAGGIRQYIQFLQQGVVGIRAEDGAFLWREDGSSNSFANCATPVFHDGFLFSSSGYRGAALIQLVAQGGRVTPRRIYALKEFRNHFGGFVLRDGQVYGCSEAVLTCVDFHTGKIAWKDRSVGMGSLVYADGHLYLRGEKGACALIEATREGYREKGRFDPPIRSGKPARAYPVVTGGRLYLRDQDLLLCYDVRERNAR